MAISGAAQVVQLPSNLDAFRTLGQGGGALLGALLRQQGIKAGGTYVDDKGQIVEVDDPGNSRQLAAMAQAGQLPGTYTPKGVPFLRDLFPPGAIAPDNSALLRAQFQQLQANLGKTQAETRASTPEAIAAAAAAEDQRKIQTAVETARQKQDLEQSTPYNQLLQKMVEQYNLQVPGVQGVAPEVAQSLQSAAGQPPEFVGSTRQMFEQQPEEYPGERMVNDFGRTVGRMTRQREAQKGLTESYQARTAAAARALGDVANIAVAEREFMTDSFPTDGDTVDGRATKEESVINFVDQKIAENQKILNTPIPNIATGFGPSGPSFGPDPALSAAKRQAALDVQKLNQARTLFSSMFEEANQKMPPIGAKPKKEKDDPILQQLQSQFPGATIEEIQ